MAKSAIDKMLSDWKRERPDADTSSKPIIYGVFTLERAFRKQASAILRDYELGFGEYSVLILLRRSGPPYSLNPSEIAETLDLTSGAVSQTLKKLEKSDFVVRKTQARDRRQINVTLTSKGKKLVDKAFSAVTENENTIIKNLSNTQRQELNTLLIELMRHV